MTFGRNLFGIEIIKIMFTSKYFSSDLLELTLSKATRPLGRLVREKHSREALRVALQPDRFALFTQDSFANRTKNQPLQSDRTDPKPSSLRTSKFAQRHCCGDLRSICHCLIRFRFQKLVNSRTVSGGEQIDCRPV